MTARSNSDTTLKQKNSEIGIEANINNTEQMIAMSSMQADRPP